MTEETDNRARLPIDWNEWQKQWGDWRDTHLSRLPRSKYAWPPKNFMADAILGRWIINGREVELSEVTFPNLEQPPYRAEMTRGIGVTYGEPDATGTTTAGPVVWSFEELEAELGIA